MRRKYENKKTLTVSNLLTALIGFLFLICLSVILVLNLRAIYYFDVEYLHLEELTGLSEELIKKNYDVLIDYNLITGGIRELEFPSFPMSENGRIHFAEVKQIFVVFQYLFVVTGVLFTVVQWRKCRNRDFGSLKLLAVFTVLIPVLFGILICFFWDQVFVLFHQIFFKNDYWLFDPVTDPVIWILPDLFFAHCAAAILIFLLCGGIVSGIFYRILRKRFR